MRKLLKIVLIITSFMACGTAYLDWRLKSHQLLSTIGEHELAAQGISRIEDVILKKKQIEEIGISHRVGITKINKEIYGKLRASTEDNPDRIFIQLFENFEIEVVKDKVIQQKNNLKTFVGHIRSDPHSSVVITFDDHGLVGNFLINGFSYSIIPLSDGIHLVSENNSRMLNNTEIDSIRVPPLPPQEVKTQADTFNDGTFVDMLAVYTPAALATLPSIEAFVTNVIEATNQSLARSCIDFRIRLVNIQQITYDETLAGSVLLECMATPNDGCLDTIPTLRSTYGADFVSLWQSEPLAIAYLAPLGSSNPLAGFSAMSIYGVPNAETFKHEFGHNMGINHDRYSEDKSNYTYGDQYGTAYAYLDTTSNFSTNVARGASCYYADLGCYTSGYYSNPRLLYYGRPLGIPGIADAAAVANSQRFFLADYAQAITDYEPDLSGCALNSEAAKVLPQCFISTAAYGSFMSPYVEDLRLFRDNKLQKNLIGRWFVEKYYEFSPPLAHFIEEKPFFKLLTRFVLSPIIWFVIAPKVAFLVFGIIIILSIFPFRNFRRFYLTLKNKEAL